VNPFFRELKKKTRRNADRKIDKALASPLFADEMSCVANTPKAESQKDKEKKSPSS